MKELFRPSDETIKNSQMTKFMNHLEANITDYGDLHKFSIRSPEKFWDELISFYQIDYEGEMIPTCTDLSFKTYGWYPNLKLNFAKNLLSKGKANDCALNFIHESGTKKEMSYAQLEGQVGGLAKSLSEYLDEGDVLACYMPNIPQTVISMLATSSLGASFTSTSSDFGVEGVLDRFKQSRPKILVAASGYSYNGKYFDQIEKIKKIEEELEGVEKIIIVDFLGEGVDLSSLKKSILWEDFIRESCPPVYKNVAFDSPLYIMYSSGTTGKPKCIVHSVGGTLVQHVKELGLHTNLTADKNIFYFTTCGWMMWNWLVSSLYFGAKVTLYEGSPGHPSLKEFFRLCDTEKINYFGTSPKFLKALEDCGYDQDYKLESLETILSTGAPLLSEQYDFIYEKIKKDINVASICGGTDILGCFMLGNPILPVYRGEIQCIGLGMDIAAFSDEAESLIDKEGELVCLQSFPSRPIGFLDDPGNKKMSQAYFEKFENVWHHGDFISISDKGSVRVFGRSDATLNPGGVRIGTSEIYRQTQKLAYIEDAICVGKQSDGDIDVILFVKLKEGIELDDAKIGEIKMFIKSGTTPRHVPKNIFAVKAIPYTRSGKKMELAISRLLAGRKLVNREAVSNPECLSEYEKYSS